MAPMMNQAGGFTFDPTKEHHGKNRFNSRSVTSFTKWLKMRFKEGRYPPIDQAEIASIVQDPDGELIHSPADLPRATWIGHATMLVQYRGINFLTDPHLTDHPAPIDYLFPGRITQPALRHTEMPKIDFIVISHNHYDHLDHRTVDVFGNSVTWYVPLGLKTWLERQGIHSDKVVELDWWQAHQFSDDVHVTFTPSIHWSKRMPWDTNKSLWGSWSVKIAGFNSWFGGDTAYDEGLFRKIGRRTGPYQLSFIPIGAYGPRYFMSSQHVDPAQAVLIHKNIQTERSIAIHWGTFQLTHEPFFEPPALLKEVMNLENMPQSRFKILKVGETLVLKRTETFLQSRKTPVE